MKPEEIRRMEPGEEMDSLVAQAMARRTIKCDLHGGYCESAFPDYDTFQAVQAKSNGMLSAGQAMERVTDFHARVEKYSTDDAKALKVFLWLVEHVNGVECLRFVDHYGQKLWQVGRYDHECGFDDLGEGPTLALAICRAALASKS